MKKVKTEGPIASVFYALFSILLWRSNLLKCASVRQNSQIFPSPIWLPSVNLYESTVPFSEKVSIVTPPYPTTGFDEHFS